MFLTSPTDISIEWNETHNNTRRRYVRVYTKRQSDRVWGGWGGEKEKERENVKKLRCVHRVYNNNARARAYTHVDNV